MILLGLLACGFAPPADPLASCVADQLVYQSADTGLDSSRQLTYDAFGRIVRDVQSADGTTVERWYVYDAFDNLLEEHERRDGEDSFEARCAWAGPNPLTCVTVSAGVEERVSWTYAAGLQASRTEGDVTQTWTLSADRRVESEEWSDDGGVTGTRTEWTYDEAGHAVVVERRPIGGAGNASIQWYTYDGRGNVTHLETDDAADGDLDLVQDTSWDDEDRILGYETDVDADGMVDNQLIVEYGAFGPSFYAYVVPGGSSATTLTYDAEGREVESLYDRGWDDLIDRRTTTRWDAEGRMVEQVVDDGDDGTPDTTLTIAYDCAH